MNGSGDTKHPLQPFKDALKFPARLGAWGGHEHHHRLAIRMLATEARLHSDLPLTRLWGYEGAYPGPSIEARSGQAVSIAWINDLEGEHPVRKYLGNPSDPSGTTENVPGRSPNGAFTTDPPYPAWTVVHLHGGRTPADSDGWPDNAFFPGQSVPAKYPNQQRASSLWYHDHAMGITGPNVHAGLAGFYILRDEEERRLGLPSGRYEIPLLIQDRNLDTDEAGHFTGALLFKLDADMSEFFGPFTLVNGTIWPHLEVEPRQYRLRVLNGANAKFFRLNMFVEETNEQVNGIIRQIGSDGGLLRAPVSVPAAGLLLAPAERADLIVDFRAYAGKRLVWRNDAPAPFPGGGKQSPWPEVIQFRIAAHGAPDNFVLPQTLSDIPTFDHSLPHTHVQAVLTENPPGSGMLFINDKVFHDGLDPDEFIPFGGLALWRFRNQTDDTHPMHIHLVQFQIISRTPLDPANPGPVAPVIDDNERGWKDTVRVNPQEQVEVMARFDSYTGRYVYHCHILEHEDHEMMRPYVVLPPTLIMPGMPGHGPMAAKLQLQRPQRP